MSQFLQAKRWIGIALFTLLLTGAALLPVAAKGGAPCELDGSWYPDGTIIHTGPLLQVCDDGHWRAVVFHHWEIVQRLDAMLLKKFIPVPPIPDPNPWCLSCPPALTVKLETDTLQQIEEEMTLIMAGLKRIDQIVQSDPMFQR